MAPVATAPASAPRAFCSQCGFPVTMRGSRCDACGAPHDPLRVHDDDDDDVPTGEKLLRAYGSPAEGDVSGLERAIDAFRSKDFPRFIDHLLACEAGAPPRAAPTAEGPGWVVAVRGTLVFVTLRADDVVLEAPIARLPRSPARHRLPVLRLALELCGGAAASSRVCARGELLLLRFSARLALLTPPVLRYHLREIAHLASRYGSLMTVGLDALPAFADEQRGAVAFDAIGRPRKIHVGAGNRRSMPPPSHDSTNGGGGRSPKPRNGARPLPRDDHADGGALQTPSLASDLRGGHLAGHRSGSRWGRPPNPRPGRTKGPPHSRWAPSRASIRAATPEATGQATSATIPAILSPMYSEVGSSPRASSEGRAKPSSRTDIELDTLSRRPSGDAAKAAPSESTFSPSDRLCMLLRHAQSLASLTLEERPATMVWLVRSAVFRAIYDFKDLLPDAVAQLYRCTGIGRDLPSPAARVSGQLQATEPSLVVMERLIVARCQVPRERALAIEPMTSAAQAKEHVARYLVEIDRAPADPPLRHFLALGALTELLVRTKLPPQTDQRLRDIVSHAQREGAKTTAIDLMMTALQRINS